MEVLHPRCAGLDVHSRQVTACVRVAAGSTVTTEHREFSTTTAGLFDLSALSSTWWACAYWPDPLRFTCPRR